ELLLGFFDDTPADEDRARRAQDRLHAAGAHGYRMFLTSLLPAAAHVDHAPLSLCTLGRFEVVRDGVAVRRDAWQSRKARDLLKLIVARRGRPAPRDWLMEALWPEQDPTRLSNRLSVALSTLRSVLDPDHRHDPDHFVAATADAIALKLCNVDVDVERF